mmetsp:Transcript_40991/g.109623  ORF Transcript_40991/g.109623 Transcript_40991/m.109623 type:complete len:166 (-) Transcript_40991:235-732(-)
MPNGKKDGAGGGFENANGSKENKDQPIIANGTILGIDEVEAASSLATIFLTAAQCNNAPPVPNGRHDTHSRPHGRDIKSSPRIAPHASAVSARTSRTGSSASAVSAAHEMQQDSDDDDPTTAKKQRRREKNRASAQQSRQRKKCHLETLEMRVKQLETVHIYVYI